MLSRHSKFLDEHVVLKKYTNHYIDEFTIESYSVGVLKTENVYDCIDTGIRVLMKGKEVYRNYRLFGPSTYQDIVAKIRKDLLNEALGIG
jgi:hypothetical protein